MLNYQEQAVKRTFELLASRGLAAGRKLRLK